MVCMNLAQKRKAGERMAEEELPKTMLILKANPASLGVVENFLRNRGWKLFSTANMKEALVQLVQQKPTYVLIAVDHANKKVRTLPRVLAQAFPVAVIAFAEQSNSTTYTLLNEAFTDYKVYPPVTGPAIERCVNKYLKDQQVKVQNKSANSEFNKGEGSEKDDVIAIRGGGKGDITIKSENGFGSNATSILSQLLGEDFGAVTATGGNSAAKDGGGQVFARSVDDEDAGSAAVGGTQTGNSGNAMASGGMMTKNGDSANGSQAGMIRTDAQVQKGVAGKMNTLTPDTEGTSGSSVMQEGTGAKTSMVGPDGKTVDPSQPRGMPAEGLGSREYRRSQAAPSWGPAGNDERRARLIKEKTARSDANQTLIAQGTQKSLLESVVVKEGPTQSVEIATNVFCIVIESERFSGYLVAAMGKDRKIDPEFITTVKKRLFKFLRDNGEEVGEEDAMGLKIKQVDFEPWALDYADFLRKSVHEGHEVAMAFFPRKPAKTVLEDSEHHEMAKIDIKELKGDAEVNFDLYVYLPANNKYVLYTPKGGIFYSKQMDRLQKQGITHMHVQKDAVRDVSKYRAESYLNTLVEDFTQGGGVLAPKVPTKTSA